MIADKTLSEGWRVLRFDQIAKNIAERVEPAEADVEYYVGLEHLDPESLKIRRWGTPDDVKGTKLRFRKGDIIFGRRRFYQRKLAVAEFDGICSAHAMVLRACEGVMLQSFLPFFTQSEAFFQRAMQISVGSLSPTINWRTLARQEFAVPPLDEQRRIAEILWAADEAVEKELAVEKALAKAQMAYIEDFLTQGMSGWHSKYKETPIGPLPESWTYVRCSEVLIEGPRNGLSPKVNAAGKGYPTLSISAIRDGQVIVEGNLKYADISSEEAEKFRLYPGDLLVVRGNGNRGLVGKCGMVTEVPDGCFYPDLLIRIKFDPSRIRPQFACIQWNAPLIHRKLIAVAQSTSGIWKVNGKNLRQHKLIVPPVQEQDAFLRLIEPQMELTKQVDGHIERTRELKWRLVNSLLNPGSRNLSTTEE